MQKPTETTNELARRLRDSWHSWISAGMNNDFLLDKTQRALQEAYDKGYNDGVLATIKVENAGF